MEFTAQSEQDLPQIAHEIINLLGEEKVVLFKGEMGAGKTTLIKELCKLLGVAEETTSPTFSIVNEYLGRRQQPIYHFDFYRIESEEEVFDLGYEDYFYSGNYCFIEWPERIPNLLPESYATVTVVLGKEKIRVFSIAS